MDAAASGLRQLDVGKKGSRKTIGCAIEATALRVVNTDREEALGRPPDNVLPEG